MPKAGCILTFLDRGWPPETLKKQMLAEFCMLFCLIPVYFDPED